MYISRFSSVILRLTFDLTDAMQFHAIPLPSTFASISFAFVLLKNWFLFILKIAKISPDFHTETSKKKIVLLQLLTAGVCVCGHMNLWSG